MVWTNLQPLCNADPYTVSWEENVQLSVLFISSSCWALNFELWYQIVKKEQAKPIRDRKIMLKKKGKSKLVVQSLNIYEPTARYFTFTPKTTICTAPALFFDVSSCSSSHSDLLWRVWPPFITKIEEANTNNGCLTLGANQPLIKGFSIKGGLIPKNIFYLVPS